MGTPDFRLEGIDGEPGPFIDIADSPTSTSCFVTEVRLQIRIRAINADGTPRDFSQSTPRLSLIKTGLTGGTASVVIIENKQIEGPDISLSCTGLRFSDPPLTTTPFSAALPPYAGTYLPTDPSGMAPFSAIGAAGRWELQMAGLDNLPVIVACWNVTFKTVAALP